jgi:beta-glucosidase
VAVIGPNADDRLNQLGDYTASKVLQHVTTILEGVRATVSPKTRVTYVKGCDVAGNGTDEIEAARRTAKEADAAIVVVGENEGQKPDRRGTVGEGYDAATLELTGRQQELVDAVLATGTPAVVVLINGRPLAVRDVAARAPAIVEAWVCGEEGGRAVAEVVFGDVNPGGKLPVTVPRHAGQLPVFYNAKKAKAYWLENAWGRPYADLDPSPLFPFGHGLSYTEFRYSNLRLDADRIPPDGRIGVSVDVENTGRRAGDEVIQLYVRDVISSVATPVLELKDFARVGLAAGEKRTVTFMLEAGRLALLDVNLERVVEPGAFEILVGSSSRDIRLRGEFVVTER